MAGGDDDDDDKLRLGLTKEVVATTARSSFPLQSGCLPASRRNFRPLIIQFANRCGDALAAEITFGRPTERHRRRRRRR